MYLVGFRRLFYCAIIILEGNFKLFLLCPRSLKIGLHFGVCTRIEPKLHPFLLRNLSVKVSTFVPIMAFILKGPPTKHQFTRVQLKQTSSPRLYQVPTTITKAIAPPPVNQPSRHADPLKDADIQFQDAWVDLRNMFPYAELRNISKPGQYLGNEFGAVRKAWKSVKVHMCLAYPDLYSIGMSSTGHIVLYSCINDDPQLLCDRSYLPGPDMQSLLERYNQPLFAVESKRPLVDFDIIGMSLMYELSATNCIKVMQLAGIPYTWLERDAMAKTLREGPPLIFAGGLTVTSNPEPFANLFDFMSIGDGEDMLPEIGRCVQRALDENENCTRQEVLLRLAKEVSGVYVPMFYEACSDGAVRRIRNDVPERIQKRNSLPQPLKSSALVPLADPVHDRLSVEVRRGCTRGCRFCLPGMVQRPARDVAPEAVIEAVKQGVSKTGYNEFSLLSLSCSDWLSLPSVGIQLKNELKEENQAITLSLGSQRVDRFDENIVDLVGGLRRSGLTFAPEAGSQRMRDVINKGLTNEDLARGVKLAYDAGYNSVKLYFMINLPSETDEDVMGIADTIKWLQRICNSKGRRRLALNVTVSTFTPKPQTPFQWHSTATEEVKRKQDMLKKALGKSRDVKLNMTDSMLSSMEDFIGRGDRRLGQVIIRAHELGAGLDAWWESMDDAYNAWCQAIAEAGLEWKYRRSEQGEWNIADTSSEKVRGPRGWYDAAKKSNLDRKTLLSKTQDLEAYESPLDRPLPWDHIDTGLSKGWLRDELMRALTESLTPDCAFNECSFCGVCGDDNGNNITISPPPIPEYKGIYVPVTERKQRIRVAFEKTGALALASHLDITRMIDRLIRRARLQISYSGGYHPHPRVVNASALPFGATASEELMDFDFREEVWASEVQHKLNHVLPDGMRVVWAREVDLKSQSLTLLMQSADYLMAIDGPQDNFSWEEVVRKVQESGPVEVDKVSKKGRISKRDLRGMVYGIRLAHPEEAQVILNHIGVSNWPDSAAVLRCELELNNQGALSPDGLVDLLNIIMDTTMFQLLHVHRRKINLSS